jgi:NADPH:quinone reductase-like Zn-dependent oxidoreductase
MRAVTFDRYGPPDVLHVAEVPEPVPREHEIALRVRACEVTKGDCEIRRGRFAAAWIDPLMRLALGVVRPRRHVLGGYLSGTVVARGSGVTRFDTGDELYGCSGFRFGGYGEVLCLPEDAALVPKPAHLTHVRAAAAPLGGLNALHFMDLAQVQRDERVLIIGAGGSIGAFAVRIAKDRGARVTAVDAAHKERFLLALGADAFVDYRTTEPGDLPEGFDVVFSTVAGTSFPTAIARLAPGGRYLMANPQLTDFWRSRRPTGRSGVRAYTRFASESRNDLERLTGWLEARRITPAVDRTFAPAHAAEAHAYVEAERRLGAVVLDHSLRGPITGGRMRRPEPRAPCPVA